MIGECDTGEQVGGDGQVIGVVGKGLLHCRREWLDVGVR